MEDLDSMIMTTLKQIGCSFCKDVDGLSLLGVDDIVEGIVRLLWICDESAKSTITSTKLPSQMTMRYRKATEFVDSIKNLGIREKLGYHSILYPNLYDVRNIFIFLIEKMPQESVIENVELTSIEQLKNRIGSQIRSDMDSEWVPGYCRYLNMKKAGHYWLDGEKSPFTLGITSKDGRRGKWMTFMNEDDNLGYEMDQTEHLQRDKVVLPSVRLVENIPVERPSTTIDDTEDKDKLEQLKRLKELKNKVLREKENNYKLKTEQENLDESIKKKTAGWTSWHDKMRKILIDPETQVEPLNDFLREGENRRSILEDNFVGWERENLQILNALRAEKGSQVDMQTNELKVKNAKLEGLITSQKKTLDKMMKQLSKENDTEIWDRKKFLLRIIYLANNVKAQKAEILNSLEDCKRLQKERRNFCGSLDRSFTVVSNWLYEFSEKDLRLKNAYHLMMKFHLQCSDVSRNMDDIYDINCQKDLIDDEIEVLKQQSADSNLEQIMQDLVLIQQENAQLTQQLRAS
ncbi:unnamed protein product [Bursaphelenchus okinawaensis]|uniref:Coiled-coil domain-containing protein 22 homolog n=1 Tax=Bursaphelenchus okinawaensis TaxID=465554 RepID=A0A811KRB6_9BILA|nr:unnamed protein product [Bursaphelenchus okinawaensis]CAG9112307.1 unnamed protein product [Bursaphelenchus okinawaensis]